MRLRIGSKILLTMLTVAVPSLLLFSMLMVKSRGDILMDNISGHLNELATLSVQTVQDLIEHSRRTLLTISASPDIQSFLQVLAGSDQQDEVIKALQRLETTFYQFQQLDTSIQAIRFIDASGFVLAKVREGKIIKRTGPLVPARGIPAVSSKANRDFFRNTMKLNPGEIWISNLERGWMEGEEYWCPAMVRFATPVFFADGTRAGVLIINVWGKTLGTMINRLVAPELGTAFIIERNPANQERHGIYLFNKDQSCEFGNQTGSRITVFQNFPASITAKWMSESEGISYHPQSGDILLHRYFSPYGNDQRGWIIVVDAKREVVMAPLAAMKTKVILSGLGIFALMIAAALFFARSLTLPIRSVIDGTHRISRDLSARIEITSRDEIGQLAEEINQMAATLEKNLQEKKRIEVQICQSEKLASIGEMAAGLAHELNTPLGNIKALAVLARKDLGGGEVDPAVLEEDLADIVNQTEKCSRIIGGLLGFARKRKTEFSLYNINDCIATAISLVQLRSEKKDVAILFTPNDRLPYLKVDGHQLEQVFVNILLNGIDAVLPGGKIEVTADFDGTQVTLRFSDSGAGIPPEILPKIFNPFFTTKETGKGTGLGLSLSYGIVKNHGGRIDVRSRHQEGTEFIVRLPVGRTGDSA